MQRKFLFRLKISFYLIFGFIQIIDFKMQPEGIDVFNMINVENILSLFSKHSPETIQ